MKRKVWVKVEYFPNKEVPQVTFYRRSRTPKNQVLSNGVHVMWVDFENIDIYNSLWQDNVQLPYNPGGEHDRNGKREPSIMYIDACIAVDEKRAIYDKSYYSE